MSTYFKIRTILERFDFPLELNKLESSNRFHFVCALFFLTKHVNIDTHDVFYRHLRTSRLVDIPETTKLDL